jgi:hypothetical protein
MPILHLNLIKKWFQYVGVTKFEEYRSQSDFWKRTFVEDNEGFKIKIKGILYAPEDVIICFSNGYSKNRPQKFLKVSYLKIGEGNILWGAEKGVEYFILGLGDRVYLD